MAAQKRFELSVRPVIRNDVGMQTHHAKNRYDRIFLLFNYSFHSLGAISDRQFSGPLPTWAEELNS